MKGPCPHCEGTGWIETVTLPPAFPDLIERLNQGDVSALLEMFEAAGAELGDTVTVRMKHHGEVARDG